MKQSAQHIIITIIFLISYKFISYTFNSPLLGLLVFIIPVTVLIINLNLRKRLTSKSWFLSNLNFFSIKVKRDILSDIPKELLYEKLKEVVNESNFHVFDIDESSQQILIGTKTNFWSWGENIYVSILDDETQSLISFSSVSLYGNNFLNTGEKHFSTFQESFEQSLTI
jgi:hypothetical protein